MTGHRLLQTMPVGRLWVSTCTCGWSSQLCDSRERANEVCDLHALDATLGPEHVDPKDKVPHAPGQ